MNAKDAIKTVLSGNLHMLKMFLQDFSDADLLVRAVPNANHAAWQLGHLIAAETQLTKNLPGMTPATLPAGFAEKYTNDTTAIDTPSAFTTKAEYLALFDKVRESTLAALDKLPDAELDTPTQGKMAQFAPNLGSLFLLVGNHIMMHAGQFSVIRRKLGKPVLF